MLRPGAADAFLNRPREDFRRLKSVTRETWLELFKTTLNYEPDLRLRVHQLCAVFLGISYPGFAFWFYMGTGKTFTTLELFRYWISQNRLRRALVLVPTDVVANTWVRQVERWAPSLTLKVLKGSSLEKAEQINSDTSTRIFVCTYPGLVWLLSDQMVSLRTGKRVLVLNPRKVDLFAKNFDALVFDESTKVGHTTSLIYKICRRLSQRIGIRYALSGRPFGRNPMMLWPQYYLVDRGETLGETLGLFREAFFTAKKDYFSKFSMIYTFKRRESERLARIMAHRSIRYDIGECLDMPPKTPVVREIDLGEEADSYYARMLQNIVAARGNVEEMRNLFVRARQISSGFMAVRDEDQERLELEFTENPKLDDLVELLDEIGDDQKVVVFHEFTYSGRIICERLKKEGIKTAWIWGGSDAVAEKNKFLDNPDVRVLVVNHKKAAYGTDGLQDVSSYAVFYESPIDPIDRDQAESRVWRDGQKRPVVIIDLVVKGTFDQRILDFHASAQDLMRALLEDPEKVINRTA